MFNIQPILKKEKMNKKQHILKHKQLFFNRAICDKEDPTIFSFLKFKLSWYKQQMM